MVLGGSCRFLVVLGGSWWFLVFLGGLWWYLVVLDGYGGSWRLVVVFFVVLCGSL